ncbi:MAG: carboxypeptidase regulatory-like domain-containing protein, partial [Acidobacteria bacterium]|nr:carboxypeptidase regulatory-like domain-containing protein [Acidobacteriota bacterium]
MRAAWLVLILAAAATAQQPTGGVSGRVIAGTGGTPVRGAAVRVTRVHEEVALGWTGPDGRFSIDGAPPGRYVLVATKPALLNG